MSVCNQIIHSDILSNFEKKIREISTVPIYQFVWKLPEAFIGIVRLYKLSHINTVILTDLRTEFVSSLCLPNLLFLAELKFFVFDNVNCRLCLIGTTGECDNED